jgi:hypothetical protein
VAAAPSPRRGPAAPARGGAPAADTGRIRRRQRARLPAQRRLLVAARPRGPGRGGRARLAPRLGAAALEPRAHRDGGEHAPGRLARPRRGAAQEAPALGRAPAPSRRDPPPRLGTPPRPRPRFGGARVAGALGRIPRREHGRSPNPARPAARRAATRGRGRSPLRVPASVPRPRSGRRRSRRRAPRLDGPRARDARSCAPPRLGRARCSRPPQARASRRCSRS